MKKTCLCLLLVLLMAITATVPAFAEENAAATIYQGGLIYQLDGTFAEAAVVQGGVFTYVGALEGAREAAGDGAVVHDLKGQFMMPGFYDAHAHPFLKPAFDLRDVVAEPTTVEKYVAAIKEYYAAHPELEVLRGWGWDAGAFPGNTPQKETLDEISTEIPIVISSYDGHSMWVNSKALNMANITRDTPVPQGTAIELNDQGDPCGTLREPAVMDLVNDVLPKTTIEEYEQRILSFQEDAIAHGITGTTEAFVYMNTDYYKAYIKLATEGKLKMRFNILIGMLPGHYEDALRQGVIAMKEIEEANLGDLLRMNACKFLVDGVVEGGTCYLTEPYTSKPDWCGEPIWTPEEMLKAFKKCEELGLGIHTHSIGDAGTKQVLDLLEQLNQPRERDALAHVQLVRPEDFARCAKLGVIAVPTPFWATRSETFDQVEVALLGEERAERTNPVKSFIDAGAHVAFSSDYTVTPNFDPLIGLENAVTRTEVEKLRNGRSAEEMLLNPSEAVTIQQGIECYTLGGAYANYLETVTGSIEVGKSADFTLLDKDITKVLPTEATVQSTWFRGECVYPAK